MTDFGPLVSTKWLADNFHRTDVKVLDASWRMPGQGRAVDHYNSKHIPGAVFFDIDEIADHSTNLPHMLPKVEDFEAAMGELGISNDDNIVVYDDVGLFSAARAWWMFRTMGHERIAVLNGGLPKWASEQLPLTAAKTVITKMKYRARPAPALCASHETVRQALSDGSTLVLDARPAERFHRKVPEPRAGLRSGHMPNARNIPHTRLLTDRGEMKSADEISTVFSAAGFAPERRVITTCGSGVTAAVLALALEVIGCKEYAVYDGSWTEWGDEKNDIAVFPVVADEADQQSG